VGYFQQGKTDLTPEAKKMLSDVAEQIRNDKSWSYLRVDAYTDAIGSQKYNTDLSLRRAIEVASYLINREGIDSSRVFVRGMGSIKQMADNSTEAGRKMNRRFEILFLRHDGNP
jgi:outer membrane protein OmpA-like peptidoglycan-associated protein